MKLNRLMISLIFFLTILGSVTCTKKLKEVPNSFLNPSEFFRNEAEVMLAANGMYQDLMDWNLWKQPSWISVALENPDMLGNTGTAGGIAGNQAGQWYIQSPWKGNYSTIAKTNEVIGRIIEGAEAPQKVLDMALGEAYFLRGYCYFDLVRRYGEVPIRLQSYLPSRDGFGSASRRPKVEVFSQIESDLKAAIELLLPGNTNPGRPNKQAAMGLLAKVYMHMAGSEFGQTQYYTNAREIANEVKVLGESTGYPALLPNYMDNFDVNTQDASTEMLFSIQAGEPGKGPELPRYYTPNVDGTWQKFAGGGGLGSISMREDFYSTFEPNDKRIEFGTAIIEYYIDATKIPVYQELNPNIPLGYALTSDNTSTDGVTLNRYGTKTYKNHMVQNDTMIKTTPRFYIKKYIDPIATVKDNNSTNPIILRYADVLLILAEAENEVNGPTLLAYEAINLVRNRAGIESLNGLTKDQFRNAVWMERRHELYGEFQTRFDLAREGTFLQVMAAAGRTRLPYQLLFPIAIEEINSNDSISVNNPGY